MLKLSEEKTNAGGKRGLALSSLQQMNIHRHTRQGQEAELFLDC